MPVDCFRELWHNFDTVRDSFYSMRMLTKEKQHLIIICKEEI